MSMAGMSATLGIAPIGTRIGKRGNARWPHRQVDARRAVGRLSQSHIRVPIIHLKLLQ
jgi:hypothetical protein